LWSLVASESARPQSSPGFALGWDFLESKLEEKQKAAREGAISVAPAG
jgi:hypothetical protein